MTDLLFHPTTSLIHHFPDYSPGSFREANTVTRSFDLPGRSPVHAANAMVATSHPLASSSALMVLREGGNAVDAAIAASAVLAVVEPHMTGIGGDCFAILAEPDGSIYGLNGSGRAAARSDISGFVERGIQKIDENSPHSVTVPGALKGWEKLHAKFGSMDWARLFADAVDYAQNGFPVAQRVAHDWNGLEKRIRLNEGAIKHLLINGRPPATGQKMAFPALGKTLERIAREGVSAFYEGAVADEIASTLQSLGGVLSQEDLAGCQADWVTPISTRYRGHDILEIPPNGQGITALIMLNLIETAASNHPAGSAAHFHEMIEFARIAYAMRDVHVSDQDHLQTKVADILSERTTKALLEQFDPQHRNSDLVLPDMPDSDTIYLSVVDRDGRAVSFINSIYTGFGSGIVTMNSGIALQNRGMCFSLQPGHPNALEGGKRPLHTIIPAMAMKEGKPVCSFGVMGGAYQPMGHAHVLVNMLKYGMDPQQALDFPRIFWDENDILRAESAITDSAISSLQKMGHKVERGAVHGGGQIISIDHENGVLTAGSDARKDGHAAGY